MAAASGEGPAVTGDGTFRDGRGAWADCFKTLKENAEELEVGQLCHTDQFNLYDSISALELMDPKMDTGLDLHLSVTRPIKSLQDAVELGLPMAGFRHSDLVGIFDRLLALLVAWLNGNSLAQTVLTCLYLHDPLRVEDERLKAFCIAVLKIVELVMDMVALVDVYEEEDYQSTLYGFSLCSQFDAEQATDLLAKVMTQTKGSTDEEQAVTSRLNYVALLLTTLGSSNNITNVQKTQRLCRQLLEEGAQILGTLAIGTDLADDLSPIQPFEPFVNSHLLAPTPPREIELVAKDDAIKILQKQVENLAQATNISSRSTLDLLDEFFVSFDQRDPGLLVRASLYLMVFQDGKVLNRLDIDTLVKEALASFDHPLPTEAQSSVTGSAECTELLEYYATRASKVYFELFRVYSNNRARRRRKVAKFLDQVQLLCIQAHDTNTALHALYSKHKQPLPQHSTTLVPFTNRFATKILVRYLMSGLDLKLHKMYEYHMVWWYLDYLLNWNNNLEAQAFKRKQAQRDIEAATAAAPAQKSGKKSKAKKSKAKKPLVLTPSIFWQQSEIWRNLTKGLLRAIEASRIEGRLATWTPEFTSLEILYKHRFAPFELVEFPEYVSYAQYAARTDMEKAQISPADLYERSIMHFQQTAKLIQDCLASSTPPPPGVQAEMEQLQKVAKTNLVSTKLAKMVNGAGVKPLVFDFGVHSCFPVIKYR